MTRNQPVILLAFASDRFDPKRGLRNLRDVSADPALSAEEIALSIICWRRGAAYNCERGSDAGSLLATPMLDDVPVLSNRLTVGREHSKRSKV